VLSRSGINIFSKFLEVKTIPHSSVTEKLVASMEQKMLLSTDNEVCHKLPYEAGRFQHAVLANNVCHNSLANGLASFACNNKVCHSLDGTLGARKSAYDP
jgi:hypothetical protein